MGASGGSSASNTGGTAYVATPKIKAVKCLSSCMSHGRVKNGGKLKLRGAKLGGVTKVVYLGAPGASDDVAVRVKPASDRSVAVKVPFSAQSGRLAADAGSRHASSRRAVTIMPPPAPQPDPHPSPAPGPTDAGAPRVETSTSRSLFAIDQAGGVTFSYRFSGGEPTSVKVTVVRIDTGEVVKTWSPDPLPPGEVGQVSWNGMAGKSAAPNGRYAFRLVAVAGAAAARRAPPARARGGAPRPRPPGCPP